MISPNLIWGLCIAVIVISFGGMIGFSLLKNKKESVLNHFPFELINSKVSNVFLIIFAISLFSPLLFIAPNFQEAGDTAILNVVITCLFGLSGFAIYAVSKVKLTYPKEHIYCSTALLSAGFLMAALSAIRGFISFNILRRFGENGGVHIALAILSALLAILMMVVLFNPKLKDWAISN